MKRMSLMAITAMMTTGAFAGDRDPGTHTDIAMNRMEIRQQQEQNDELMGDIHDQQQQIFDLMKDKEDIQADLRSLQMKRQRAADNGRSSRVARLDRKIDWDQALLAANRDHIRELLSVESNDMGLMNRNGERISEETATIQKDRSNF